MHPKQKIKIIKRLLAIKEKKRKKGGKKEMKKKYYESIYESKNLQRLKAREPGKRAAFDGWDGIEIDDPVWGERVGVK